MRQATTILSLRTEGPGLVEVTQGVADWIAETGIGEGLLTALCRHTSASLMINENAAPAVKRDMVRWLDAMAPQGSHYEHDDEGPDDMPAHLKSALTGANLSVPVAGGRMLLGTWQGLYLVEHRTRPHTREVALHLIGE
ncbi:secondary thiamine-phosphate synthase enzyme YjbQ [Altererythrobacter arenosus]|uniref:Secondary thiamine-phosphate synthase enzyme YjbQ n=1 Tax=Altererythrobacter arenosus TaxID=3032592 RepID=A0ABY8FT03_9SPHN|nr:secondary thiamine-phosphate synthase enzyme YjbQ [Altererythrobacter sp. CAU 1644]WFL78146.1 secondary thiamine-phosphate synthase enzyme YjbQ [Altererythrobacter sp. CAU 1644]